MECTTRKICYITKDQAEQALLGTRARYSSAANPGPVAVYRCPLCECYHLTSKGDESDVLRSADSQRKIDLQREAYYWEGKIKGGR